MGGENGRGGGGKESGAPYKGSSSKGIATNKNVIT